LLSDWLLSLEGTEGGKTAALLLALQAAFLHAFFGALQKGRTDPWTSRSVIDACYALIALPIASGAEGYLTWLRDQTQAK